MTTTERVRVFITVDTEFSIGGAFDDPINKKPVGIRAVELPSENGSEGLGFLLRTLNEYCLPATFFVETCNAAYFGSEPISQVIKEISAANHDTQLHLHPCWSAFSNRNWQESVRQETPSDSLANYSVPDIVQLIREGMKIIQDSGAPAPVALRAGNLHAGMNIYDAMEQTGIPVGSNIGLALHIPKNPEYQKYGGCISIGNTMELPVLSYQEMKIGRYFRRKALTVIGSTYSEMELLLKTAYKKRLRNIVILTHPSEFSVYTQPSVTNISANEKSQRRFKKLCAFLSQHSDQYDVTIFSAAYTAGLQPCEDPVLDIPLRYTARRLFEGTLKP